MNVISCLERARYNVKEIEESNYPILACGDEFMYMESVFLLDTNRVMCFPYYREEGVNSYVEIYVWDCLLEDERGYKRFVIQKDHRLTQEEEDAFLDYLTDEFFIDDKLLCSMIGKVNRDYPGIHLTKYEDKRHVLLHLYYAMHISGPAEIMFKANLNVIATNLQELSDCNLIGDSPKKILGLQMGMIRALNSPFGLGILCKEKSRIEAREIYAKYHNFIRGKVLTPYQWKYLQNQFELDEKPQIEMLNYLKQIEDDTTYYSYLSYLKKKQIVDVYYSRLPQYPPMRHFQQCVYECDMLHWCIENQEIADYHLRKKAMFAERRYAYESEKYVVKVPRSVREILSESEKQHNCLYSYLARLVWSSEAESIILFIREKDRPDESLITMEIEDERIVGQAYAAFNKPLNEEEREFLMRYMELKNLMFEE